MKTNIGEMIKYLRKQQGVTQDELANVLNLSNQSISKWETGQANPDVSFVPKIAEFFKVSIDTLFNCVSEMPDADFKLKEKGLSDDAESLVDMWEALHIRYPNDCRVEKELVTALCGENKIERFEKIFYHVTRVLRTNQNHDIEEEMLNALKTYLLSLTKNTGKNILPQISGVMIKGTGGTAMQTESIINKLSQLEIDEMKQRLAPKAKKPSGKNVLIADDATIMRMMLKKMISVEGFNVVGEAENGEEGVVMAGELLPDFVLMDINMPKMNGLDSTSKILESNPDLPVIIVSSLCTEGSVRAAFEAGAVDFVAKPFTSERLLKAIQEIFI